MGLEVGIEETIPEADSQIRLISQDSGFSRREARAGFLNFQTAKLNERMNLEREAGLETKKEKERGGERG